MQTKRWEALTFREEADASTSGLKTPPTQMPASKTQPLLHLFNAVTEQISAFLHTHTTARKKVNSKTFLKGFELARVL